MGKTNTLTTRKVGMLATALLLVVALLSSLFALTLGKAADNPKPKLDNVTYDYIVTFDANGGKWTEVKDGKEVDVTTIKRGGYDTTGGERGNGGLVDYNIPDPTRPGYEFEGWSALADASKVNVEPGKYNPKQSHTVKAVWYKLIDVAFDDQQGHVTHIYVDKAADDNQKTLSIKDIPEPENKDGKVFAGWYTDKAATSEALGYAVQVPNEDVTYYAGYSEGATVQLVGNGGHYRIYAKGETSREGEYEYHINKTVHYQKGTPLSTKADPDGPDLKRGEGIDRWGNIYGEPDRFVGYYTDKSFDPSTKVDFSDPITKDMTLYARWDDGDYYYVTYKYYDANAKQWKDLQYRTVIIGDPLTQEQAINADAYSDYFVDKDGKPVAFTGWYTDKALTKEAPKFDGSYTPNDDITLYAKTAAYVDVNLTYWYSNDNSSIPTKIDTLSFSYVQGSNIENEEYYTKRVIDDATLRRLGIDPTEAGISTTWYTDRAHSKIFTTVSGLKKDVNIYGAKIDRQALTLNTTAKNSYIVPGETQKLTINVNKDATLKEASDPYFVAGFASTEKAPKAFYGWSLKDGDKTPVGNEEVGRTRNLYAIIDDAYILTFDMNGGYTIDYKYEGIKRATSISYTVPKNTEIKDIIDGVPHFYYGDKVFKGWTTDKDGKNLIDPETFTINANTTLYAKWARYDEDPDFVKLNGIVKGPDGKWAMYKDGLVDTSYTGIAKNDYGWWRVENGYVNFNAQGIYKNEYGWWKTTDGKVTFNETGIFKNEYGWWRVVNSKVDFNAQGIYKNQYGWWKTTDGKVTFKETGVFKNEYGWWRVENSKVNFKANGIYKNQYGWWKTTNGKVTFKETGIFKNEYGTWYVKDSKVDFSKNGKVTYNGKTYNVTKGKAKLA